MLPKIGMKRALVVMVLIVLLAGCSQTSQQQAVTPEPVVTGNQVSIENFKFNPSILIVQTGVPVTWTNKDSAPHTVKGEGFGSSTLNKGETFMHQFTKPGTYKYTCGIHPSMEGTIIVQ